MKKLLKVLGFLVLAVVILAVALFAWLTITEYRPADVESVSVEAPSGKTLDKDSFTVLSLNVGYCALGKDSDFFMDGGKDVRPESEQTIRDSLDWLCGFLKDAAPDFTLLQEVDSGSRRSYGIDEAAELREALGQSSCYAYNFHTDFVPYPWPPIGKVRSGLMSLTGYRVSEASRVSLPCPFSWPVSTANLKRCLLVSRVPIEGSDRELVLVNLHLEAYDDGEGKLAQTNQLLDLLAEEYAKGNCVIAGGDFNQSFPDAESVYPNTHPENYLPGTLSEAELGELWRYAWDASTPTCRLLNQPYDPSDAEGTQYYVIDGFLVSPNLEILSTETLDEGFAYTDHNPVLLTVRLKN